MPRLGTSFIFLLLAICSFLFFERDSSKTETANAQEDASGNRTGIAVVELFTSEGCSSCPPADRNLIRIDRIAREKGISVFPLSFHVDYWNGLGWQDPFSSKQSTNRQRAYAKLFSSNRVYTPQIIVNGCVEFVGSNSMLTDKALEKELKTRTEGNIAAAVKRTGDTILVAVESDRTGDNIAINCALTQKQAARSVTAGENAGRKLEHVNVVRAFRAIRASGEKQTVELEAPASILSEQLEVVVFTQSLTDGKIDRAIRVPVEE